MKFKAEFEKKLIHYGIKEKFLANITVDRPVDLESFDSWFYFIAAAFEWKNTPEGFDYWKEVSEL